VDNIKRELKEIVCDDADWIHLEPVVGSCGHGNKVSGSIKGGSL